MKRILSWIVMVPFAAVVIVFSAVNRDLVTLDLWPFPHQITVPIFTLVLCLFIFGFLWGGAVAWISGGEHRRRERRYLSRAEAAERELRSLTNKLHERERQLQSAEDDAKTFEKPNLPTPTPGL